MPGWFVVAIIAAIIAVVAGVVWFISSRKAKKTDNSQHHYGDEISANDVRRVSRVVTLVMVVLAVLFTFISSFTVVSTKNVGIETSFGRPVGSLSNGPHLIAPWDSVTEMDAAIQTDSHTKSDKNTCVTVRIAHQAVACVDVTITWRIVDGSADSLFQNYRDFDNVRDSLVTRELNTALNAAFENYDPLAVDDNGNSTAPSLNNLAQTVKTQMTTEIGNDIEVRNILIPVVHFDDSTQGRINALQAQIAQTRIADQAEKTAAAQAAANKALAGSVSNDPNVLVSKCLDLLNDMVSKGQPIPVGFSCWPGGSSSVVVPAK